MVLRGTFGHLGRQVVELLNVEVMTGTEMMELVEVEGEERVEQARAQGKGVMYYTGHFGYWGVAGDGSLASVHATGGRRPDARQSDARPHA